jgi:hypothetical protein
MLDVRNKNPYFSRLEKKELLIRQERGKYGRINPLFSEYLKNTEVILTHLC